MNATLKNYSATLLLVAGIVIGGLLGFFWGPGASVLRPVGNLFLNLIFVLVVPLVFLMIAQSMVVLRRSGTMGKVIGASFGVFFFMSLIAGILAYAAMILWHQPFDAVLGMGHSEVFEKGIGEINLGDALVGTFTVNDFPLLLSREHLLPLIVFAAFFGLAVAFLGDKVPIAEKLLTEGCDIVMKMMDILMKFAPIGIGCYFADTIGQLGGQIVGNYLAIFLLITGVIALIYFVIHSLYAVLSGTPLKRFWKAMVTPSLTAIGTSSSAACMPVNIAAVKGMGVSGQIAQGVIPLGTNLHKDGSVVTSVAKVLFTLYFFGMEPSGFAAAALIILLSVVESMVVGAVPVGGMTGELLICSILGVDPSFAATLLIIGTICDIPATLLNVAGNTVAPVLVDRLTRGKS